MNYKEIISNLNPDELKRVCSRVRHVAFDMDGTIYLGDTLFPYTEETLSLLKKKGISYSFLTNNPTRSRKDYLKKLARLGIDATEDEVYTSTIGTIDYMKSNMPDVKRLFVLGTESMHRELEDAGYVLVAADAEELPDALIVAFDTSLVYPRLCYAAWLAERGIPYIATNPDRVCPTDRPTVLVDCGSICSAIEYATGRHPDIVIGKPNPDMLIGIATRHGIRPEEIAVCGDRIYTDVKLADNAGALGVLVLSGETTLETAMSWNPVPKIISPTVLEFASLL